MFTFIRIKTKIFIKLKKKTSKTAETKHLNNGTQGKPNHKIIGTAMNFMCTNLKQS